MKNIIIAILDIDGQIQIANFSVDLKFARDKLAENGITLSDVDWREEVYRVSKLDWQKEQDKVEGPLLMLALENQPSNDVKEEGHLDNAGVIMSIIHKSATGEYNFTVNSYPRAEIVALELLAGMLRTYELPVQHNVDEEKNIFFGPAVDSYRELKDWVFAREGVKKYH